MMQTLVNSQTRIPPELMAAIERAESEIRRCTPGSVEFEKALADLRQLAAGPGAPAAQWLLGSFYLSRLWLPDGRQQAFHWLELATQSGVPPAIDRLANLYLRELGQARQPQKAVGLLQRLADAGFQAAAWDLAYLLDAIELESSELSTASAFARACALAYPPAYYSLGLRFALGQGVAKDPAFATALLRRAADAGYPDAADAAAELGLPAAHPQVSRWYAELKQNVEAARPLLNQLNQERLTLPPGLLPQIPLLEAQFAELRHPDLLIGTDGRLQVRAGGQPVARGACGDWQWLSQDPRVAEHRAFASREECAHLQYVSAASLVEPKEYTGDTVNGAFETLNFSGRAHSMGAMFSDTVVRVLEHRMATALGWDVNAIEPCSVIAYQPGQDYDWHADFFSDEQIKRNREEAHDPGGQRVITFLLCIHAPQAGGGTVYRHNGLTVKHELGKAAIHYNVTLDGKPDPHSLHCGSPVGGGEKWLLRTTLREHSRYS